ncbi:hypothetical protein CDL15_Pgr025285 [Punica granatum]|uniref:Beta-glucosidase 11-like n=1 Tax=Punica granatum TaxID=22663 RepID=A0A218W9E5_PUNGR|nr:hypothetical protein CDL15_Pgr025285 [Punica granatum]
MWKLCELLLVWASFLAAEVSGADRHSRHDFPSDFVFGAGTSAYQVEGAANEDGRTPSIFDTYAHSGLTHGANGDVACDQYHKYKEDVQLMVETGLEAYRFSISWSRLIPNGRGPVNPKGLQYYNHLIDELISHGVQPHVTLHHADLPQALEDEKDFTVYAEVCFREFGDRIRHWTTFNEANVFVLAGYDSGILPPQRCSFPFGLVNCSQGNSSIEPYLAAHNILLAHASAARTYKNIYQAKNMLTYQSKQVPELQNFYACIEEIVISLFLFLMQERQKGYIGFNIFAYHFSPFTNSTEDIIATQRAYDFYFGWLADPLVYGDYPETMKKNAGPRIPSFTPLESKLVKGSFDFLGINFYDAVKVMDNSRSLDVTLRDYQADTALELKFQQKNSSLFELKPWALQGVLEYIKQTYGNPPIYIHENGVVLTNDATNATLEDVPRVELLQGYIGALLDSLRNGSNARGYFTWSFMDVFELLDGYDSGFGLYYVDLDDPDLKRYPKHSAHWYSQFLKGGRVDLGSESSIELRQNLTTISPSTVIE